MGAVVAPAERCPRSGENAHTLGAGAATRMSAVVAPAE
jgi:hypothetical protein